MGVGAGVGGCIHANMNRYMLIYTCINMMILIDEETLYHIAICGCGCGCGCGWVGVNTYIYEQICVDIYIHLHDDVD